MTKQISIGKKIYAIGSGWLNLARQKLGILDESIENEAVKRMAICLSCEKLKNGNFCGAGCGCYAPAKTLQNIETCPLNKW